MIKKLKEEVAELKAKLAKAMLKESFAATKTDKAILVHETEELNIGTEVFVEDEEGKRIPAEDGIYTLENGNQVKVGNGKVEEIVEPTEEYATKAEVEAMATVVTELKDAVDTFFAKVNSENEKISARLSKVEQMPAGKTPAKEFKNEREVKTGDSVLDRKLEYIRRFKK